MSEEFLGHPWASWIEILSIDPCSTTLVHFACTSRGALRIVLQSRLLQLMLRANRSEQTKAIRVTIDRTTGLISSTRAALRIAAHGWQAISFTLAGPDGWTDDEHTFVCHVLLRCMSDRVKLALARLPDEALLSQLMQFSPHLTVLPSRSSLRMLARRDVDELIARGRLHGGLRRCDRCVRAYGVVICCRAANPMCLDCQSYEFDKKRARALPRVDNCRAECAADRCVAIGTCFDCQLGDDRWKDCQLCSCVDCRLLPNSAFVHSACRAAWLEQQPAKPSVDCLACDSQMCPVDSQLLDLCTACRNTESLSCGFCAKSFFSQREANNQFTTCMQCRKQACLSCRQRWRSMHGGADWFCPFCIVERTTKHESTNAVTTTVSGSVSASTSSASASAPVDSESAFLKVANQEPEEFEAADSPLGF
jgi:hypothetical protein